MLVCGLRTPNALPVHQNVLKFRQAWLALMSSSNKLGMTFDLWVVVVKTKNIVGLRSKSLILRLSLSIDLNQTTDLTLTLTDLDVDLSLTRSRHRRHRGTVSPALGAGNLAQHLPRSCSAQTGDTGVRVSWLEPHVVSGFELNVFHKYTRRLLLVDILPWSGSSAITAVERDRTGRPGRQSLVMIACWSQGQSGHTGSSQSCDLGSRHFIILFYKKSIYLIFCTLFWNEIICMCAFCLLIAPQNNKCYSYHWIIDKDNKC